MKKRKGKRPPLTSRPGEGPTTDVPLPEGLRDSAAESSSRPSVSNDRSSKEPELREWFSRMFVPPELYDAEKRREWQLGVTADRRGPYIVELNLQHVEGLSGADIALRAIYK